MTSQQLVSPTSDCGIADDGGCQHYWIIEASVGPVSRGICRICDKEQLFKNFIDSAALRDDTSPAPGNAPLPVASNPEVPSDFEDAI